MRLAPPSKEHAAAPPVARFLCAACAIATLGLAGCGTQPQRMNIRDTNAPDATAFVSLRPTVWSRAGGRPARGFEAGYQQFTASGPQALSAGETLLVNGQSIPGPDTVAQKAKVAAWHFGYTDRLYFGPVVEFDIAVGGLKLDIDYELRAQAAPVGPLTLANAETLPYGSITPRYRFGPMLALEARIAAASNAESRHNRQDLSLLITPVPQLMLRLGYARQRTSMEVPRVAFFDGLEVQINARGPAASLRLEF
jgi:hypothetical protein